MSWKKDIEELKQREALAEQMGGEERVARQKAIGKLTARDRVDVLLDAGSFHETGKIAGRAAYGADNEMTEFLPTPFVVGRGLIDGRPVAIQSDDFSVRGGAADAGIWQKLVFAEQMANEYRMPLVRLIDGTGGGGSVKMLEKDPRTYIPQTPGWEWVVANMASVPVVSLALGPCAGLGAGRVAASHYSVMVQGLSQVFVAGPPVAKAIGEDVDKEGLGGAEINGKNGVVDDIVGSEAEAFAAARKFLSYLPASVHEAAPRVQVNDPVDRRDATLIDVVPRDRRVPYKMRRIVDACVDAGSFFETGRQWGRGLITGFARIDGWSVAVIAGDPMFLGGAWTADVCRKLIKHVDLAQTFHLPVVHFVDCPGFAVGVKHERSAVVKLGVQAMAAVYQARVTWCSIVVRQAFGLAGSAMMNPTRLKYRYCWPSGDWGSLPMEGGIEAAYKREIEAHPEPEKRLKEIRAWAEALRSPFRTAESFYAEEIIDPRDTRPLLCEWANLAQRGAETGPSAFGMRP
ncbi:acyl-CoA carboxylase subunit beta [Terricaulis silvestris]|uniref:Methylmalonyl-CoA carboxyltransferase 12S subunit n=1 Tax=Terricaulis silvestris TaxID=2686094 RepID=A0A6I6MI02_9CAUL|nr:carboxyl transferase domain-containing protein [Terricaulis silvestris]QGZ94610.1 Methylmalonyl-CoA carboxyltransferase 12S subunit [Terricaulis silvestris]